MLAHGPEGPSADPARGGLADRGRRGEVAPVRSPSRRPGARMPNRFARRSRRALRFPAVAAACALTALAAAAAPAAAATPAAGCAAPCAGAAATARSLAPSSRVRVRFAARLAGVRSAALVRLDANALTVGVERRRIVLRRDGRRVRGGSVHVRRQGWVPIPVAFDARRRVVRLRADRRRRVVRLRGLRPERRVVVGDCARPRGLRLRRIRIVATPARRSGRPVRSAACPRGPAPVSAPDPPPASAPTLAPAVPARFFAEDSFWNRPLPASGPMARRRRLLRRPSTRTCGSPASRGSGCRRCRPRSAADRARHRSDRGAPVSLG
jgi:hypothetical protein